MHECLSSTTNFTKPQDVPVCRTCITTPRFHCRSCPSSLVYIYIYNDCALQRSRSCSFGCVRRSLHRIEFFRHNLLCSNRNCCGVYFFDALLSALPTERKRETADRDQAKNSLAAPRYRKTGIDRTRNRASLSMRGAAFKRHRSHPSPCGGITFSSIPSLCNWQCRCVVGFC